jgi:hypothetical protein
MNIKNRRLWQIVAGTVLTLIVMTVLAQRTAPRTEDSALVNMPSESSRSLQTLFVLERKNNHLGEGAAISPDGNMLVYIGGDNGLYLRDLETEQERLLLKEAGPGLDVFLNPVFSPDGTHVLFSAKSKPMTLVHFTTRPFR